MHEFSKAKSAATGVLLAAVAGLAAGCRAPAGDPGAAPQAAQKAAQTAPRASPASGSRPDLTGRSRAGDASFYADKFAGRPMADGHAMDPQGVNAASKTLPLGTTAKVTNVNTGQSTVVTIEDRGPHLKGRIVDLSPAAARSIGITEQNGVGRVTVAPISVPLPDGSVKAGVASPAGKP